MAPKLTTKRRNLLRLDLHVTTALAVFEHVLHQGLERFKQLVADHHRDRRPRGTLHLELETNKTRNKIERVFNMFEHVIEVNHLEGAARARFHLDPAQRQQPRVDQPC